MLVDDHPMVRDGLAALLASLPGVEVAASADSGEAAIATARDLDLDLVVMDVAMPGAGGIVATRHFADAGVRVLVLTMLEDPATLVAALDAGASGYLTKSSSRAQVAAAVQAVHAGHLVVGEGLAPALRSLLGGRTLGGDSVVEGLSSRQLEVLSGLAQGLDNVEIGEQLGIAPKTVANTVSELLTRLGVPSRAAAAAVARRQGIGV